MVWGYSIASLKLYDSVNLFSCRASLPKVSRKEELCPFLVEGEEEGRRSWDDPHL